MKVDGSPQKEEAGSIVDELKSFVEWMTTVWLLKIRPMFF
jgi:hypothetical protein